MGAAGSQHTCAKPLRMCQPPACRREVPAQQAGQLAMGLRAGWAAVESGRGAQGCSTGSGGTGAHRDGLLGGEGERQDPGLARSQLSDGVQQDKGATGVQHGEVHLRPGSRRGGTGGLQARQPPIPGKMLAGCVQGYGEILRGDVLDGDLLYAAVS